MDLEFGFRVWALRCTVESVKLAFFLEDVMKRFLKDLQVRRCRLVFSQVNNAFWAFAGALPHDVGKIDL